MKRVLLAGVLGGLALFAWESVAHLALPLGQAGIKAMDNEQPVLAALRDNVKQSGLYFFPGAAATGAPQPPGPEGIMAYNPSGTATLLPSQLVTQLGGDMAAMILAGFLLISAGAFPGLGKRLLFFALMGLLTSMRTDLSYWNWYGFPGVYTASQFLVNIVGFCVGGLVLAKMIPAPRLTPVKQAAVAA